MEHIIPANEVSGLGHSAFKSCKLEGSCILQTLKLLEGPTLEECLAFASEAWLPVGCENRGLGT